MDALCDMLGIEFPLFAFSHCRDVVAAVVAAGGFGVFGRRRHSRRGSTVDFKWIDEHVERQTLRDRRADPGTHATTGEKDVTRKSLEAAHPRPASRVHSTDLLNKHGIDTADLSIAGQGQTSPVDIGKRGAEPARRRLQPSDRADRECARRAAASMLEWAGATASRAALVGAPEHAIGQVPAGVDILVVAGTEAGGHCGEVSTMVLVPEVIEAVKDSGTSGAGRRRHRDRTADGGVHGHGRCRRLDRLGVADDGGGRDTTEVFREKMLAATSRDTVRSRGRTGKPARQLRSAWTDALGRRRRSPGPLPMPLQGMISAPAIGSGDRAADAGNAQARELVSYFVGQGVGLVDSVKSAGAVVQEFKEEFIEAVEQDEFACGGLIYRNKEQEQCRTSLKTAFPSSSASAKS